MLDPDKYLMVALRLTKEASGKQYHKILSASRRCLENFSLAFGDTGYRLVLRSEEAELVQCLTDCFMGFYTDEDMVFLSAPVRDDYSEYYYGCAEEALWEELANELLSVADRITAGNRITARTYAESVRLLNRLEHHMVTPESTEIRDGISSIYKADIAKKRKRTARFVEDLAVLAGAEIEDE